MVPMKIFFPIQNKGWLTYLYGKYEGQSFEAFQSALHEPLDQYDKSNDGFFVQETKGIHLIS